LQQIAKGKKKSKDKFQNATQLKLISLSHAVTKLQQIAKDQPKLQQIAAIKLQQIAS